jgi:hypothetical protein
LRTNPAGTWQQCGKRGQMRLPYRFSSS